MLFKWIVVSGPEKDLAVKLTSGLSVFKKSLSGRFFFPSSNSHNLLETFRALLPYNGLEEKSREVVISAILKASRCQNPVSSRTDIQTKVEEDDLIDASSVRASFISSSADSLGSNRHGKNFISASGGKKNPEKKVHIDTETCIRKCLDSIVLYLVPSTCRIDCDLS